MPRAFEHKFTDVKFATDIVTCEYASSYMFSLEFIFKLMLFVIIVLLIHNNGN